VESSYSYTGVQIAFGAMAVKIISVCYYIRYENITEGPIFSALKKLQSIVSGQA